MADDIESKFQAAIRKKREAEAERAEKVDPTNWAHLVPGDMYEGASPEKTQIDEILDKVGIIQAYNQWCAKSKVHVRPGQKESIKVRCPRPGHVDNRPDAWLNTEKNLWHCGPCEQGGDMYDIAAYHFGLSVPGYKAEFPKLKKLMAESMGYLEMQQPGKRETILYKPDTVAEAIALGIEKPALAVVPPIAVPPLASVTMINADAAAAQPELPEVQLKLDWREIVEPNTFLDVYMHQCIIDDAAEEYHFFNALLTIGLAVGRDVKLFDTNPVYGNLLVCLLGKTGDRKSRSFGHTKRLLSRALHFDPNDDFPTGVQYSGNVASGEALINIFQKPVYDPVNPKIITTYAPVRGLVNFEEFSALAARASRPGNTLKDTIISFYDADPYISTSSMTHKTVTATDAFCSIFATTQPESLKGLMTQSDTTSGFLNRWVFIGGTSKPIVPIGGVVVDIEPCIEPLQDIHVWRPPHGEITWSEEAAKLFTKHFHSKTNPAKDDAPMLARLDLLEKKLILLLCINGKHPVVTEDIVRRVILMHEYIVASYAVPTKQAGMREENEIVAEIKRQVERITAKNASGATWSSLTRALVAKNWPDELIRRKWEQLIKFGEIEEQPRAAKTGRPTQFFKLAAEEK